MRPRYTSVSTAPSRARLSIAATVQNSHGAPAPPHTQASARGRAQTQSAGSAQTDGGLLELSPPLYHTLTKGPTRSPGQPSASCAAKSPHSRRTLHQPTTLQCLRDGGSVTLRDEVSVADGHERSGRYAHRRGRDESASLNTRENEAISPGKLYVKGGVGLGAPLGSLLELCLTSYDSTKSSSHATHSMAPAANPRPIGWMMTKASTHE